MFSVRLVTADSYMSKPLPALDVGYSEFRGSEVNQVPVIRVFGSTPTGEKVCLHVHGVFPYLYVPCVRGESPEGLVYRLASALDKALNVSLGCSTATTQHVYCVSLVSAIPFYGYHSTEQQFLKVCLYNPAMVKRAADLLQSGAVLGRSLQPHEAHLPFMLQFMVDYNLHGMSPVVLERAQFRRPAPSGLAEAMEEELLLPESIHRVSSCEVEADALATAIVNPRSLHGGVAANPGLAGIWEEEKERRRAEGRCSQPTPLSSQGSQPRAACPTSTELRHRQVLQERIAALRLQEATSQTQDIPEALGDPGMQEHCADNRDGSVGEDVASNPSTSQLTEEDAQVLLDLLCLGACSEVLGSEPEPEEEEEEGEDEEDQEDDLTLPLEPPHSCSGSAKADAVVGYDEEIAWEDSYWDQFAGRIPQLDGAEDDDDDVSMHSPVICSGKLGRQCAAGRAHESRQLTSENVIDGTRWPEYRGLLDGLGNDMDANQQRSASPGASILEDCEAFPYDLGLDLDCLEVGPICNAPTPGAYESLPLDDAPSATDLTNYNLADMSEDYSSALINDVFLSAITDDATQCTDMQPLTSAEFPGDIGFHAPQSESVFDGEAALSEETLRRAPALGKPMSGTLPVGKEVPGLLRSCEDRSVILGPYAGPESLPDIVKAYPSKQLDAATQVGNYVMMTHSDVSVNILNSAMVNPGQIQKIYRDNNTYVRLVPLSEYRSRLVLGDGDAMKTCVERGDGVFSSGVYGPESYTGNRRVVSVDRTTETSPSLLRCTDSGLPGRDPDANYLTDESKGSSTQRDTPKKVVKFFLKSSLLREKSNNSPSNVSGADDEFQGRQLKSTLSRSNAYHSTLIPKSQMEKSSKLFPYNEKSLPQKVNNICEPFAKKSRAFFDKFSGREMEGHTRCGGYSPSNRYYSRLIRDSPKPRNAPYHVRNAEEFFMSRKEPVYRRSVSGDRLEGRRSIDVQLSPTTSEEKFSVKVENSPARSRGSPEDSRQCTCYSPGTGRKQGQGCRSCDKGDYDPYEFSDEMEELLSCGSPPSWPRRCAPAPMKPYRPGPSRGGKPASYLQQQGALHRARLRMTHAPGTSPTSLGCGVNDPSDEMEPLVERSRFSNAGLGYAKSLGVVSPGARSEPARTPPRMPDASVVVEHIKSEPVWEEEVTSIPKLTLVRTGDSYINLVRLDDGDETPSGAAKQEQLSDEDKDKCVEVAAVKDENDLDSSESSGILEQSMDDKSVIIAGSQVSSENRVGDLSDDCVKQKSLMCELKDASSRGGQLMPEASCTIGPSVPAAHDLGTSNLDCKDNSFPSCENDRGLFVEGEGVESGNSTVEVINLSPSSDGASVEILEVLSPGKSSSVCGGKALHRDAKSGEQSPVETDEPAAAVDCAVNRVDVAVPTVPAVTLHATVPATPPAQPCNRPVEDSSLLVNRIESNSSEAKETPEQLMSKPLPPLVGPQVDAMVCQHEHLIKHGLSDHSEAVHHSSAAANPKIGENDFLKQRPKYNAEQARKVRRAAKILGQKVVGTKMARSVVRKDTGEVKLKEGITTRKRVKSRCTLKGGDACNEVDKKSSVCGRPVLVAVTKLSCRPRGRPRKRQLMQCAGQAVVGVQDLHDDRKTMEGATACPKAIVPNPSHPTDLQSDARMCGKSARRTCLKQKKNMLSTAVKSRTSQSEKTVNNSLYQGLGSFETTAELRRGFVEPVKIAQLECSLPSSSSEHSGSVLATSAKSSQTIVSTETSNSEGRMENVGDMPASVLPEKPPRARKQKNDKLENSKLASVSKLPVSSFVHKKLPKTARTIAAVAAVTKSDQIDSSISKSVQQPPVVSSGVVVDPIDRDAECTDGAGAELMFHVQSKLVGKDAGHAGSWGNVDRSPVTMSPAGTPTKGRKKILNVVSVDNAKTNVLPMLETEPKLNLAEVSHNPSHSFGGCKILSVSLSKALPKCKSNPRAMERLVPNLKCVAQSGKKKLSRAECSGRKGTNANKQAISQTLKVNSTLYGSKQPVLLPVPPQVIKKKSEVKSLSAPKKGGVKAGKKDADSSVKVKQQRNVNRDAKVVASGVRLEEVKSSTNSKVEGKQMAKSKAAVSNKQTEFETSMSQLCTILTENLGNKRKRPSGDAVSASVTGKKHRKKSNGEMLCGTEGQDPSAAVDLKPKSKQCHRKVGAKCGRPASRRKANTRAALKTVCCGFVQNDAHCHDCSRFTSPVCANDVSSRLAFAAEKVVDLASVNESLQKLAIHQQSSEKSNNETHGRKVNKTNRKSLQPGKLKIPKINNSNVSKKTLDRPVSSNLRSGKKVSSHETSYENVEQNNCGKLLTQSCRKSVANSLDGMASGHQTLVVQNRLGRPCEKPAWEDPGGKQQRFKTSGEMVCGKPKTSKVCVRNSYVKQLRSYASKRGREESPPSKGRGCNARNGATPTAKISRSNVRIPCLDGASGTSSEEELLIDCSQPSSPEPPFKKLKGGFMDVVANCRAAYRAAAGDGKVVGHRRRRCPEPKKGRLGVDIMKSPRRQHIESGGADAVLPSSELVPVETSAYTGHCLATVEATGGYQHSRHKSAVQDAGLVTEDNETAKRLLVPSKSLSEEKPKIVQFNDKDFLFPSACDNLKEEIYETVGAMNHRSVRKKLRFSAGQQRQQQQQQSSGGKQIKILRRSSLDMFADSSSLSGDAFTCSTEAAGEVCESSRAETDLGRTVKSSEGDALAGDERPVHEREDSDSDEGIVSFYETTLLSPAESGCSHDSLGSLAQLPLSPWVESPAEHRYHYQEPFYGDPRDVTGPMRVGGLVLHLRHGPPALQAPAAERAASPASDRSCERRRIVVPSSPGHDGSDEEVLLSPDSPGPVHSTPLGPVGEQRSKDDDGMVTPLRSSQASLLRKQVLRSQLRQALADSPRPASCCQVAGTTPDNTHAFLLSFQNLQDARPVAQHTFLTLLSIELHVSTRGELRPDPQLDPIQAIFYAVFQDIPGRSCHHTGVVVVGSLLRGAGVDCQVECVADERALLAAVERLVTTWDPDILAGYEVEMMSWGYLFQRGFVLGQNLCPRVSRIPDSIKDSHVTCSQGDKARGDTHVAGRILLDVWRLMRHQVTLQSYTFESVVYHVLHQRRPLHSHSRLTSWWDHPTPLYRWIVVEHYVERAHGTVRLLEQLDLLATTSELARLFGIQFLEVLNRGSQFRVESMMLRLARLHNYVAVSPSVKQRAGMRAPEFLQLIMEPESRFFADPVIVMDFQSLYPSIIIAYNYCFSTCLGRTQYLGQQGPFRFGCSELSVPLDQLERLLPDMSISPCGVAFVGASTRLGILPRMLQEILHTRLMVKRAMKQHPEDKLLQRVLHARQLGLKLIANVTYGYTAANFSGRMPCVEVGDSVVSKGRETLERAIQLVENTARWDARVVYGDTDSMFVLLAGRSRAQAFAIGAEIAQAVTLDNPAPVKLKLEKVYQPCILQTKKRYVGYAYESPEQEQPTYDAKGIETVRRDGCPAVAKILEKALRVLFETRDVSLVKRYVCRQWDKLVQGRANTHDLVFAREYRGRAGYRPGACVPALHLAKRWLQIDPRAEPRSGERVPYVIVNGPPGVPLIRLVRSPRDLLSDPSLRLNATYYITRVIIPALRRCFSLLGADVDAWYASMPRRVVTSLPLTGARPNKCTTISQYFATVNCAACDQPTHGGLCPACLQQQHKVAAVLADKVRSWERAYSNITQVCRSCCGRHEPLDCISLDCPVLFRRSQAHRDLMQEAFVRELLACHLPAPDW